MFLHFLRKYILFFSNFAKININVFVLLKIAIELCRKKIFMKRC